MFQTEESLNNSSMDSSPNCPICNQNLPPSQLQRHVNSHFDTEDDDQALAVAAAAAMAEDEKANLAILSSDEQLARDLQLAEQLSLTATKPRQSTEGHTGSCLVELQTRAFFRRVEADGGLMTLLYHRLLESEARNEGKYGTKTTTFLCGYVDHYQSKRMEDSGWGCGYRNIQMLASHLLSSREDTRKVLFGGCGFVPDIPFLQGWIEMAWKEGFDPLGSQQFNHSICGSTRWIGTTECAALFRSFGVRARIVDFGTKESESLFLSVPGTSIGLVGETNVLGKRKSDAVYGPMDRYLLHIDRGKDENGAPRSCTTNRSSQTMLSKSTKKDVDAQVLVDWVWKYFSQESSMVSALQQHVVLTGKAPLYFQHDGHSRTIVGIQHRQFKNGLQGHTLLILDPGYSTEALERSLKEDDQWEKAIKRGVHTLNQSQYQICYIDPGIASREEMEHLKSLDSTFIEL
ncbi:Zinc finger-containing ubiquitin peptidase 1 [Linum perenne]